MITYVSMFLCGEPTLLTCAKPLISYSLKHSCIKFVF
jgi:hypothetical protein